MKYALRKLLTMLLTIFIISLLAFLAFQIIPGDPTVKLLGTQYTPERAEALRESLGLNENLFLRYWKWLSGFVTGDLGISYSYNMPVSELLSGKIGITAALSAMAFVMTVIIGLSLGLLLARYEGKAFDRIFSAINQITMSVPPFFMGIIFTCVFGLVLKLFTVGKFVHAHEDLGGFLTYLFFPALAIALPKAAMTAKLLRSSAAKEMQEDYVRTAISRGNRKRAVLYRHVLRNSLIPVITFLAVILSDIVAGSIVIEQVFSIPGLGRMLLLSISNRDYPVTQAIVVMLSALVVVVTNLADLAYQLIDPRIRLK